MVNYPTGDWYRKYMMTYEDRVMEEFKNQIMKGDQTDLFQQSYKELLNSGMFFEFHPELTGDWDKDKDYWNKINNNPIVSNETYLDVENNIKSVEEQLRERILQLEGKLEDAECEIEIIKSEVQGILSALSNAVENGVQLNIGIVVGQTMSKLTDIIYK
jgi:hypothetical protein